MKEITLDTSFQPYVLATISSPVPFVQTISCRQGHDEDTQQSFLFSSPDTHYLYKQCSASAAASARCFTDTKGNKTSTSFKKQYKVKKSTPITSTRASTPLHVSVQLSFADPNLNCQSLYKYLPKSNRLKFLHWFFIIFYKFILTLTILTLFSIKNII